VVRALCSGSAYFFSASSPLPRCSLTSIPSSPSHFPPHSRARLSATRTVPIGTLGFFSPLRNEVKLGSVRLRAAAREKDGQRP